MSELYTDYHVAVTFGLVLPALLYLYCRERERERELTVLTDYTCRESGRLMITYGVRLMLSKCKR